MPTSPFSAELREELIEVMQVCVLPESPIEDDRLATVTLRVASEARRTALPSEAMVIGLRHVFEVAIPDRTRHDTPVIDAYDRFLTDCIRAYYRFRSTPTA